MLYNYLHTFTSKKNNVRLVSYDNEHSGITQKAVLKDFTDNIKSYNNELNISNTLYENNINTPKIINTYNNTILYQYVGGDTLLDILEHCEKVSNCIEVFDIFDKLCIWLSDCYAVLKKSYGKTMILGDCHLRNFIYSNNIIYGVDFECVEEGILEQDIAYLCAFTLTYSPMLTDYKYKITSFICKKCIELMNLDADLLKSQLNIQIHTISERRKIELTEDIVYNVFKLI